MNATEGREYAEREIRSRRRFRAGVRIGIVLVLAVCMTLTAVDSTKAVIANADAHKAQPKRFGFYSCNETQAAYDKEVAGCWMGCQDCCYRAYIYAFMLLFCNAS